MFHAHRLNPAEHPIVRLPRLKSGSVFKIAFAVQGWWSFPKAGFLDLASLSRWEMEHRMIEGARLTNQLNLEAPEATLDGFQALPILRFMWFFVLWASRSHCALRLW